MYLVYMMLQGMCSVCDINNPAIKHLYFDALCLEIPLVVKCTTGAMGMVICQQTHLRAVGTADKAQISVVLCTPTTQPVSNIHGT